MTLWTDDWIAGTHPLTPEERGVFITLVCHFTNKDRVVPDDDIYLARLCNMGTRPYRRIKKNLIDGCFLEQREGHIWISRSSKQYENDQKFSKSQAKKAKEKQRYKQGKLLETKETVFAPDNPSLPLPLPRSKKIIQKKNGYDLLFMAWYKDYPNKKGIQAASKAYAKVIKEKRATHDELIKGRDRYIEDIKSKQTEKKFIAHPASWLNGDRWADEYENKEQGSKW